MVIARGLWRNDLENFSSDRLSSVSMFLLCFLCQRSPRIAVVCTKSTKLPTKTYHLYNSHKPGCRFSTMLPGGRSPSFIPHRWRACQSNMYALLLVTTGMSFALS